ncbi:MAG: pirin family protein [Planctomycetia bacterium]
MITLRRSGERGRAEHGWLHSRFSFSFAEYFDPRHMGWRSLRVINDDKVAAGAGFPMHGHRDMEIVTWMLAGRLEHRDSMGNGSTIGPGELQYMSAGKGVMHSEFNPSRTEEAHLLQIWVLPRARGLEPRYGQADCSKALETGEPVLVASPDGERGSIAIAADARIFVARANEARSWVLPLATGRGAWVHVAKGEAEIGGHQLVAGDAAAIEDAPRVEIAARPGCEVLVFDLA